MNKKDIRKMAHLTLVISNLTTVKHMYENHLTSIEEDFNQHYNRNINKIKKINEAINKKKKELLILEAQYIEEDENFAYDEYADNELSKRI